jgi:hypothetical protein
MDELLKTTDPVLISFVEALLKEAGIGHLVVDRNMSLVEGSLGILPCRVLVEAPAAGRARRLLAEAGLAAELKPAPGDAR